MEENIFPAIGKVLHLSKKYYSDLPKQIWTCCVSAIKYFSIRTLQTTARSVSRHQGQDIITLWQEPRKAYAPETHPQSPGALRVLTTQERIQPRDALLRRVCGRGERSRLLSADAGNMVREDRTVMLLSELKLPHSSIPQCIPRSCQTPLPPGSFQPLYPLSLPDPCQLPGTFFFQPPQPRGCQSFTLDSGSRNRQRSDIFSDIRHLLLLQNGCFCCTRTLSTAW